ncbi:MAG: hypothetical protein PHQ15_06610 [Methanosarcina sp.]|nr:hypothetical protein [Methanosarcina sp.]
MNAREEDECQDGRVVMLPAATRNYVSSILTPDFSKNKKIRIERN